MESDSTSMNRVVEFMDYLRGLRPAELTTFYCEICHDRLNLPAIQRPTAAFQENTGRCSCCDRIGDISNPKINQFLNERGMPLDYPPGWDNDCETALFRDWLIPSDYINTRWMELKLGETEAMIWLKYGRKKSKQVYRSKLSETNKSLLTPFFSLLYAAGRMGPADQSAISFAYSFTAIKLDQEPAPVNHSTFERLKTFVASILHQ